MNYFSRLLDLGFEQDLSFILSTIKEHTSRKVQKVLLSATLSQGMTQTINLIKLSNESVFFMLERMYIVYTGQTFKKNITGCHVVMWLPVHKKKL